mgnify:CR=1 FL=1
MQGSARKDVVFGAARVYTVTVPGPKWKSWLSPSQPSGNDTIAGELAGVRLDQDFAVWEDLVPYGQTDPSRGGGPSYCLPTLECWASPSDRC